MSNTPVDKKARRKLTKQAKKQKQRKEDADLNEFLDNEIKSNLQTPQPEQPSEQQQPTPMFKEIGRAHV